MVRVAIIEDSKELAQEIAAHLTSKGLCVTSIANNGLDGQKIISDAQFDILLLDLILPNIDGLTLIKNHIPKERPYKVICFSAFGRESVLLEASDLGVDYFLLKPVDLEVIHQNIIRLSNVQVDRDVLDAYFNPKLKGTQYLHEALRILENDREKLDALTLKLYPEIAAKYYVNNATIERAIRHAIDKAWHDGLSAKWQSEGRITKPKTGELLEYMLRGGK